MTRTEAEKRIGAALKKAGFSPRVKKGADIHVVGLAEHVCRVRVPVKGVTAAVVDKATKAAIEAYRAA